MPNSSLQNRYYTPSDKVLNKIESALSKVNIKNGSVKGFRKAKEILQNKRINYQQMKNLKTYFDNYEGDGFDDEYKLIGGDAMKKWVDETLTQNRDVVHDYKKSKMDAGEENQFIKTHEKDQDNANPTAIGGMINIKKSSDSRAIMNNDAVYEEIKSIKQLINYINK